MIASPDFQVPPRDALGAKTQARRAIRNRVDDDQRDELGAAHEICWGAAHAAARHPLVRQGTDRFSAIRAGHRRWRSQWSRPSRISGAVADGSDPRCCPAMGSPAGRSRRPRTRSPRRARSSLASRCTRHGRKSVRGPAGFTGRSVRPDPDEQRAARIDGSGGRVRVTEPWRPFSHCYRRRAGSATVAHTSRLAPGHRDLDRADLPPQAPATPPGNADPDRFRDNQPNRSRGLQSRSTKPWTDPPYYEV